MIGRDQNFRRRVCVIVIRVDVLLRSYRSSMAMTSSHKTHSLHREWFYKNCVLGRLMIILSGRFPKVISLGYFCKLYTRTPVLPDG